MCMHTHLSRQTRRYSYRCTLYACRCLDLVGEMHVSSEGRDEHVRHAHLRTRMPDEGAVDEGMGGFHPMPLS